MLKKSFAKVAGTVACAAALAGCLGLSACGGSSASGGATGPLKDGTYLGTSSVLDANVDGDGYVEVQIQVKDGAITDATYKAYEPDGTLKDDSYGKDGPYYGVAQKALKTGDDYLAQFLETGDPAALDTISGATYMHDMFVEAAEDAIKQASAQ